MSNRIKDLNNSITFELTDVLGLDRVSPDETFKVTGQVFADRIGEAFLTSDKMKQMNRNMAQLIAVADIDDNAPENSGKFYDLFQGENEFSQGIIDEASTTSDADVSATDTEIDVVDASDFAIGEEVTIQGDYNVPVYYDIDSASYDSKSFVTTTQEGNPRGVSFSSDGSKMYVVGLVGDSIFQYTLLTPWDVSTAEYAEKLYDPTTQTTAPFGAKFNGDGTSMFINDFSSRIIYQYTLSTAWDVSSASYATKSLNTSSQITELVGFCFNSDGSKIYAVDDATNEIIYQYNLSTEYDLSTGSYASKFFDITSQESSPQGIAMNADGSKVFIIGTTAKTVFEYDLSTPDDISSASYNSISYLTTGETTNPQDIFFSTIGDKFYIIDSTPDEVFQYSSLGGTPSGTIRIERKVISNIVSNTLTIPALTNNYASGAEVYRSLYTITAEELLFPGSTLTEVDIRYNIIPVSEARQVLAWVQKNIISGYSITGYISIVDTSDPESYVVMTKSTIALTVGEEDEFEYFGTTAEEKITLKLKLIRNSTSDVIKITKILGAID